MKTCGQRNEILLCSAMSPGTSVMILTHFLHTIMSTCLSCLVGVLSNSLKSGSKPDRKWWVCNAVVWLGGFVVVDDCFLEELGVVDVGDFFLVVRSSL